MNYEYGYPAVIWADSDDNFILNEHHELIIRFNTFKGSLRLCDCDDDDEAILKAKVIATALKSVHTNF